MDNYVDTSKVNETLAPVKLPSQEIEKSNQQPSCEPCLTKKLETAATNFCRDCDERYCDNCTSSHKTQKATREHNIVDIKYILLNKKQCEPCSVKQKQVTAAFACVNCEEFLCEDCKTFHISQKPNKSHRVKYILEEVMCEPCHSADKLEEATSYCQDCNEPEPLCRSCADLHIAMKMTRGHRMSHDIANFILRFYQTEELTEDTNAVVTPSIPSNDQPTCEPCGYRKITVEATYYCKDCEEMYCKSCMLKHKSKKNFAKDGIIEVRDILKTLEMCEPCKYNNAEVVATLRCDECDEHLCEECKNTHLAQKKE